MRINKPIADNIRKNMKNGKKSTSSESKDSNISDEKWSDMQKKETDEIYSPKENKAISPKEKKSPKREERSSIRQSLQVEQPEETGPVVNDIPDPTAQRKVEESRAGADTLGEMTGFMPNLLVGAAPLLMGAIMGDVGEGASVAGTTLLGKEKREWDAHQSNLKSMRSLSGKKDSLKPVYNPETGQTTYVPESQAEGMQVGSSTKDLGYKEKQEQLKNKYKLDYAKAMGRNLVPWESPTGDKGFIDKVTGVKTFPSLGQPNRLQRVRINKVRDDLMDVSNQKAVDNYHRLSSSLKALKSGNQLAAKNALKEYVSQSEGGGKLTDFDVEFMQYLFGKEKYKQKAKEFLTGKMDPRLAQDLGGEMARALDVGRKAVMRKYNEAYKGGSANGLSPAQMRRHIGAPEGFFKSARVKDLATGDEDIVDFKDLEYLLGGDEKGEIRILGYE